MKPIVVTVSLECRDDVPERVLEWMAENLATHALHTFGFDYDYDPGGMEYDASPLLTSCVRAQATLDREAIENDRVWRQRGAPPSSMSIHEPQPGEPIATRIVILPSRSSGNVGPS